MISNLYYRGFVYVVCGPQGKVKEKFLKKSPQPANDLDDDDEAIDVAAGT